MIFEGDVLGADWVERHSYLSVGSACRDPARQALAAVRGAPTKMAGVSVRSSGIYQAEPEDS